ncbi:MAG: cytochrome c biogenesis protein ResB [Acidobacteria bacterium]|nr:cytochrome c biogenesis protein ResB [Acidobacteriota bacterium]
MSVPAIENVEPIAAVAGARPRRGGGALERILKLSGSVRVGITLLVFLGLACTIGMLVMQQNVAGFADYYAELTPVKKMIFGSLGFFNIYYSWYFNALLAAVSLNIIIATLDRLPKILPYFSRPSVNVPLRWLREQRNNEVLDIEQSSDATAEKIEADFATAGWGKPLRSYRNGTLFFFAEKGRWNRLAFCAVHIALLTIFLGGFLTAQLGSNGSLPLYPGQTTNLIFDTAFDLDRTRQITKQLPFDITCTDIEQRLIRHDGPLTANNTIDWITRFTIRDETGVHTAEVGMNRPYDHRGYRFFQGSFVPIGRARSIRLSATTAATGATEEVTIKRSGTADLADGTRLIFSEFRGDFSLGPEDPNEDTTSYTNPAAIIHIKPPGGGLETATVFGPEMADIPAANKPYAGFTFRMLEFERVSHQHVLAVQRDPGSTVVYIGFALLSLTLAGVFGFSHRRVWAAIEQRDDGTSDVTLGGNTNRNPNGFDEQFERLRVMIERHMREDSE